MQGTIGERMTMCGSCYAGRNGICSSAYAQTRQTDICLVEYRKTSGKPSEV